MERQYYKNVLNRFISLATCVFDQDRDDTYADSSAKYEKLFDAKVYFTGTKQAKQDASRLCKKYGRSDPICAEW